MCGVLVGRAKELEAIDRMLREARAGRSGVLVVHGDPGIGKTAMLDAAGSTVGEDFAVLRASGVESEARLPYATLHQLLHPMMHRADALPAPQRESLRGAF